LSELSASLSAADLHVVAMGDPFVGIVHPCKIYNILSVGTPVLYIGPAVSPLSEIAEIASIEVPWFSARHGDVDQVIKHIQSALVRASKPSEDGRTPHPGLFTNPEQAAVGQASPPAGSECVHVGVLPRPHYALGPGLDSSAMRALFSKEKLLPKLISELEVK
jgi:hypothetical protein